MAVAGGPYPASIRFVSSGSPSVARIAYHNPHRVRRPKAIAILTGIIGVFLLGLAAYTSFKTYNFLANAQVVSARVVAMRVDQSGKTPSYRPMFEVATDGATLRIPARMQSPDYGFQKGQMVDVLFNPSAPGSVRMDNWNDTWKPVLNLVFIAGFFLAMALMATILHRRWMRERPDYVARDDYFPQDGDREVIFFNASGRVYFLRKPRLVAIVLGIPGLLFLGAGIYTLGSGTETGQDGQGLAFLVGAAMLLALAGYAWWTHVKWRRARARAEAGKGP